MRQIMKNLILLTLLVTSTLMFGQYTLQPQDKYSDEISYKCDKVKINNGWKSGWVYFTLHSRYFTDDNVRWLQINVSLPSTLCFSSNSYIHIMLENGDKVKLLYFGNIECESSGKTLKGLFEITHSDNIALSLSKLSEFRIQFSDGYIDYIANTKVNQDYIMRAFNTDN